MTDNSHGYRNEMGMFVAGDIACQRFTGGITLSLAKPFRMVTY